MKLETAILALTLFLVPIVALANQQEIPDGGFAPEFLIDTVVRYHPEHHRQASPATAWDGTNYLAVWFDERQSSAPGIYGTRISASGTVLEPAGIRVSGTGLVGVSRPAIAFTGTSYLVLWEDWRQGSADIYAARVSTLGQVLDPGIPVSSAPDAQTRPAVAPGNGEFLAVWEDLRNGVSEIRAARITGSGVVRDTDGIAISAGNYERVAPSVCFDGQNFLVVWQDSLNPGNILGARVSQSGVVLDSAGIRISTAPGAQQAPTVSFNGTNYLVAWQDSRGDAGDVYAARVTPQGAVLDPNGIPVAAATGIQQTPRISPYPSGSFIIWSDNRSDTLFHVRAARVSPGGQVIDPQGIVVQREPFSDSLPDLACDGSNLLAVWQGGAGDADIRAVRLSSGGTVLDTVAFVASTSASPEYAPAAAFDGTNYLVAWRDMRTGFSDLYDARISLSGTVLDRAGIPVSRVTSVQRSPAVAFGQQNYLVVWEDYRNLDIDLYCSRINRQGVALDTYGLPVSVAASNQHDPAIAFDGENYLVAWHDYRRGYSNIFAARVTQTGVVLDPGGIAVGIAPGYQRYPSVAWNGRNYLVVWEDDRTGGVSHIYGARVDRLGNVLDTAGILISGPSSFQDRPSVASDGTNSLVVWQDWRGINPPDIYGARVSADGIVLDTATAIVVFPTGQENPDIAFDGASYVVVWEDLRHGDRSIYGAELNPAGTVIDTFSVSNHAGNQWTPTVCVANRGQFLCAWSGWADSIGIHPANTARIWARLLQTSSIREQSGRPEVQILRLWPNPTRSAVGITCELPQAANVELAVFDIQGRLIRTILTGRQRPGRLQLLWDGRDAQGRSVSSGVYYVGLKTGTRVLRQSVIVVRD